jgi:putative CocE/NonD family hydrolase
VTAIRLNAALLASTALLACAVQASAQTPAPQAAAAKDADFNDIPKGFRLPSAEADYVKRVVMIPMRDGVKLYTVIWIPKGAHDAPIILTRTPYDAAHHVRDASSPTLLNALPLEAENFVKAGYIRVYQDVRGKYGSEGGYVMTRPPVGALNPTKVDHTTDAWDTIDWLVKNLPESNGKVGMIGSSYEGFTVVMALLNPHPALKAAVPESPMVDGWMGDDWFHYGAFRNPNIDYTLEQTGQAGEGKPVPRTESDDYTEFLNAGSTGDYIRAHGLDKLPYIQKLMAHPAYDAFWQGQALDKLVAAHPSTVPTLWEQGLWDQEDMWGANHAFAALKAAGHESSNWLVMGPWFHSQINRPGEMLGVFKWDGDTAAQFRRDMVLPFFEEHLRGGPPANLARATVYDPGLNRWERFDDWPSACADGCKAPLKPLYLEAGFGLGFEHPASDPAASDSYISDPSKPVPHTPRPVRFSDGEAWRTWLVRDQRFIDGRPDVLTYVTPPLTKPLRLGGKPVVDLWASTTGTDGDFVVKLVDVYPAKAAGKPDLNGQPYVGAVPDMGGYEAPLATDIFRGRYRASFEHPSAVPAKTPQRYRFALPDVNTVIQPGHRLMVLISSSAFPLYDRNPQTYVENMFDAKPGDYQKATITVLRGGDQASAVWLPVVTDETAEK